MHLTVEKQEVFFYNSKNNGIGCAYYEHETKTKYSTYDERP